MFEGDDTVCRNAAQKELPINEERRTHLLSLGAKVEGCEAIAVYGPKEEPIVLRVASLLKNKPFPTLFWLVDASLVKRISNEEHIGLIDVFQARVNHDISLQQSMIIDHEKHIQLRASFMSEEVKEKIRELKYERVFKTRGIGGLEKRTTIRCLHTWYASHLVQPNTVGRMLDDYWKAKGQEATAPDPTPLRIIGTSLLNKKTTYREMSRTMDSLSNDEQRLMRMVRTIPEQQFAGVRNFRVELLEAHELFILVNALSFQCIVDVGCGHGITSRLIQAFRGGDCDVVWVDQNPNCHAATLAEEMKIPFAVSVADVIIPEKTLFLIVNVCGSPLLEVVDECCRKCGENALFCVVPCCGPDGVSYQDWISKVQKRIPANTRLIQMENNLKRTAIVSYSKP